MLKGTFIYSFSDRYSELGCKDTECDRIDALCPW